PKSEMTGAVFSMDGRGLDLLRGGGLITMGIIKYADIFGDLHLVEFCHRAQFGPIDWEGVRYRSGGEADVTVVARAGSAVTARGRRRDFSTAAVSAVAAGATLPSAFHA